MYKPIRKADLVLGGTSIKQGEIFTLGFQLFDANGLVIVPTVGQTITVKVANKTGVVFETTAVVVDDHIEFTVAENIGAGKMRVELTVADGVNVLQKYPANGYIELYITASLDDIGTGTIYTVTAAEMFTRIEGSETASADAVQTAGEAVVIAGNAVVTADAVRADFDLVVAEAGSSNPEVVLARGGEADLSTRLNGVDSQLAEMPLYAAQFGVSHLNTATANTLALRNAVTEAGNTKRPLILPVCPPNAYIDINDRIYSSSSHLNIQGFGANTRIRQTQFPRGIFWLDGDYCYIGNFHVYGVPFDARGLLAAHGENAGVAMLGSYSTVENIYGDYLSTIVRSSSIIAEKQIVKNRYINIESGRNVVFNFVIGHSKDCYFDQIKGSYSNLSDTPPHLIYADNFYFPNYNLQGGFCQAWDGEDSFAFQFKGCIGGNAGTLHSHNCAGSYHIMDSVDFNCREVVSTEDTWIGVTGQGSLTLDAVGKNVRCNIDKVYIRAKNGVKLVLLASCEDCEIKELDVAAPLNATDGLVSDYVDLRSTTRCKLHNPKVVNTGTAQRRSSILVKSGQGNEIINPTTSGNQIGVLFDETNVGINRLLKYNIEKQTNYTIHPVSTMSKTEILQDNFIDKRQGVIAFEKALSTYDANTTKYTSSGAEWIIPAGRLVTDQLNGNIYTGSALSSGVISYVDTGYVDSIFEATLKYNDWDTVAIKALGRYDFLGVRFNHTESRIYLVSVVGSVLTNVTFATMPIAVGMSYRLKVIVIGSVVRVLVDGIERANFTITTDLMTTFGASLNYGIWGRNLVGGKWSDLKWSKV